MFLLSGLQLVMMGVIGSYLGRVCAETQAWPLYSLAMSARGSHVTAHAVPSPRTSAPVDRQPSSVLAKGSG